MNRPFWSLDRFCVLGVTTGMEMICVYGLTKAMRLHVFKKTAKT